MGAKSSSKRRPVSKTRGQEKFVAKHQLIEQSIKPKTVEPKTLEPKTVEPKTVEPKTVEPKTAEPKTVEPKTVDPKSQPNTPMVLKTNNSSQPTNDTIKQKDNKAVLINTDHNQK